MSDETPEQKSGAPPIPAAIAKQAPGVRGAKQAPVGGATLHTGDVIGGKFVVSRLLGSSDGAVSYLCKDRKRDRDCVIKVIDMAVMPEQIQKQLNEDVPRAGRLNHKNLNSLYGMGQVDPTHIFVAMEYVHGSSLARVLTQRRELGKRLNLRDVFTVVAHLCNTVELIHGAGLVHSVLTPYNIAISRHGVLKVSNLVFGYATAAALLPQGLGPFSDSVYVAPEVIQDPTNASPASDVYSIAMICVELLSLKGLPGDRTAAAGEVKGALSDYPTKFKQLILRALSVDPEKRPATPGQIRDLLEEVARGKGFKLGHPPEEGELPIEPAVQPEVEETSGGDDDLFDLPDLEAPSGVGFGGIVFDEEEEDDGRYLVQIGGLDYGPFTEEQVLEQLYADDIDENTQVLDRITQERVPLESVPAFAEEVAAYIPKREQRRAAEAAARAELQRKVKKGGVTVFVIGIVAGLFVLAGMIYVVATQPDPKPLPMDRAFASLDFKLLPPPKDFETVAGDKGVMQSIFNPEASEAEIEKQIKKLRKKRRTSKKPKKGGGNNVAGVEDNITEVDMSSSGSKKILSDAEVNEVILGQWGSLRRCVMKEFQTNPKFKGVTVQFFIRPSGTTGGVKVKEKQYASKDVGRCLVSRFRSMKFPAHGGFNKGVTFPLLVQ